MSPLVRRLPLAVAASLALAGVAGCSGGSPGSPADAGSAASASESPTPTPTPPPRAKPVAAPDVDTCHRLDLDEAVAPTDETRPVPCAKRHTTETYAVGTVDNLVDGHLLAVDSRQVQDDVADACPDELPDAVGGSLRDRRLSVLRSVWFTPSLDEAARGADWFRCDLVALDGPDALLPVTGSLQGVLDTPAGRDDYGMCGTTGPDDKAFERVPCREEHSWRAIDVVDLPEGDYPGEQAVADAGEGPCQQAGADAAADPLDYEWQFEGPDRQQWEDGQTFIRCWVPD